MAKPVAKPASAVSREDGHGNNILARPEWNYKKANEKTGRDVLQLEMLESIRNTLESILAILTESEIVYLRGKGEKNG